MTVDDARVRDGGALGAPFHGARQQQGEAPLPILKAHQGRGFGCDADLGLLRGLFILPVRAQQILASLVVIAAKMRAIEFVHEILARFQVLRQLVDRLAVVGDLASGLGDRLALRRQRGALLLQRHAIDRHGGGDTAPAKQQCSRAAQRPKLGAATDTEEFDLAARTQENFPLRAKRIPPCAEGDDPLAIQLQQ